MKLSPVQVLSFCGASLLIAATFVLCSAPMPRAGQGRHMVRMPVDPRIIDLETLNAPNPQDNATTSVGRPASATPKPAASKAQPVPEKKTGEKTGPSSGEKQAPKAAAQPKSLPAKKVLKKSSEQAAAKVGTVRGLFLKANEDGSLAIGAQTSSKAEKVTYMRLAKPDRLVVDIHGRWTLRGPNVVRSAEGPAQYLVAGQHEDRLRLVLHFRSSLPSKKPVIRVDEAGVSVIVPAQ